MDPCAALQVRFDLLDGAEKEVIFQLGNGENLGMVQAMIGQFAGREAVMRSLQGKGLLAGCIGRGAGRHTRSRAESAGERLAAL